MNAHTYLHEQVNYGGVWVTRAQMLADLQLIANRRFPHDRYRQRAMVNAFLAGFDHK